MEPELELSGLPMWGLKKLAISSLPEPRPLLGLLADRGRIGAEVDDRRRDVLPLAVGDHLGPAVGVAVRDRRVRRPQVDADEVAMLAREK